MKNVLALALLVLGVSDIVAPAAACEHASTAKSADAAPAPPQSDAASTADQSGWSDYEASLTKAMRSSNRPRDWALAAIGPQPEQSEDSPAANPGQELKRAAQRAPNDALVQWLAANNADSGSVADDARIAPAIARLTQLESDNGAVWMLALNRAVRRNDSDAVANALTRIGESRRFDDHFLDTAHAWLDAYDRYPAATPLPDVANGRGYLSASFTGAVAKAAAVAMPSYGTLMNTCKTLPAQGDADATARCAAAGRLMLAGGKTLLVKRMGFGILRSLGNGVATEADRTTERDLDWYVANMLKGTGYDDGDTFAAQAYEADWRRMDDEVEVIKSALRRAGLPSEAPKDWQPASSTTAIAAAH